MPGAVMSPVVPPKDPNDTPTQISIRTGTGTVAEMDLLAEMHGRTRTEVANYLWHWALEQAWKEENRERPKDPLGELEALKKKKKR